MPLTLQGPCRGELEEPEHGVDHQPFNECFSNGYITYRDGRGPHLSCVDMILPSWSPTVHHTDGPATVHRVPANKGHEAMAYLTNIIDHYDRLPNVTMFVHYHRYSWHTDAPNQDQSLMLESLRLDTVVRKGYVRPSRLSPYSWDLIATGITPLQLDLRLFQ
jgi:hypothetical protein